MLETVAKAVLIVVSPFLVLRMDCATSLAPRQLLKGDGLHKYGRLCDLFGVAAEVLSGAVRWRWSDELNCRGVESQFASIRSAARPQTNSLGQATPERRRGCPATIKSGLQEIRELIAFSVGKSRPDDSWMLGCYECCGSFNTQRTVSRAISSSSSVGMT